MKILTNAFLSLLLIPVTAHAFDGSYSLRDSVVKQSARITRLPNGAYGVKLEVTTPRCVGEWEAVGMPAGDVLVVEEKNADGLTCSVAIRRTVIGIDVKEFTCDMHGARCSFDGQYTRVGPAPAKANVRPPSAAGDDTAFLFEGSKPSPTTAPAQNLAGRFYCAEEINLDRARADDPNYRIPPIEPNQTLSIGYDFYYHGGSFTFSGGGDSTTYRSVRVVISGDKAVYTGPKGARWTVSPVGARTVTIQGTGIRGSLPAFACSWR